MKPGWFHGGPRWGKNLPFTVARTGFLEALNAKVTSAMFLSTVQVVGWLLGLGQQLTVEEILWNPGWDVSPWFMKIRGGTPPIVISSYINGIPPIIHSRKRGLLIQGWHYCGRNPAPVADYCMICIDVPSTNWWRFFLPQEVAMLLEKTRLFCWCDLLRIQLVKGMAAICAEFGWWISPFLGNRW